VHLVSKNKAFLRGPRKGLTGKVSAGNGTMLAVKRCGTLKGGICEMWNRNCSSLFVKGFAGIALAGMMGLCAQQVRADDCQKRVDKADHQLHEAIEHRGYQSDNAEHARHELQEAREQCWNGDHRWWDPDQKQWHNQRDWDDNDHQNYNRRDDQNYNRHDDNRR